MEISLLRVFSTCNGLRELMFLLSFVVDFLVDFSRQPQHQPQHQPLAFDGMHKKKTSIIVDYQCFLSVGVTGFEPATTRPPDDYIYCTDNAVILFVTYLPFLLGLIVGLITA